MKIIFYIILILVIFGAIGYFKATPSIENQTGKQPDIEITPKFFDFGEVEYGKIAEHAFVLKNLGEGTLEIKRVATSCACTTGKVSNEKIAPNEETLLIVTYDTGAMSGPHGKGNQERIIYIKSNDPINPQVEVKIKAYVR
ncbi:MAG TPA: DUF1573 domain-containing protein [bacterium]|nr:DUF1573 domain-containing protein [bacterium]